MFIEQINLEKKDFVKYIAGSVAVIFFNILGQIPLTLYVLAKGTDAKVFEDQFQLLGSFPSNTTLFLILIPFAISLLGLWLVITKQLGKPFKTIITIRKKIDRSRILFSFLLWGGVSAAFIIISYFLSPTDFVWNFKPVNFLILFLISIVMIKLQTSAEELFFRGYLLQGFGVIFRNRWLPLITTSIIFGMLHIWNPEIDKLGVNLIWYYIGTGLFLGVITLMDEGLELALGFHAANNLVTALLVTASWTSIQTESLLIDNSEPSLIKELIITFLVVYPILIFLFSRKYGWKNWKQNLTAKF
jgi:membrane protease YdiL (CAAX protease family)